MIDTSNMNVYIHYIIYHFCLLHVTLFIMFYCFFVLTIILKNNSNRNYSTPTNIFIQSYTRPNPRNFTYTTLHPSTPLTRFPSTRDEEEKITRRPIIRDSPRPSPPWKRASVSLSLCLHLTRIVFAVLTTPRAVKNKEEQA